MTDPLERPDSVDIARTCLYQWLSLALSDPSASRARWLRLFEEEQRQRVALAAQVLPYSRATPPGGCAPGEVPPAQLDAGPLLSCSNRPSDVLEREYRHVFGLLVGKECPANETEYCPQTFSVYRAQRMADVAGFYRAFAVQPSSAMPERPDHISLEFEFMAWLIVKRRRARASGGPEGKANATTCFEAERTFFAEHLAWWVPAFARALRRTVGRRRAVDGDAGESESFLGAVATFLSAFIAAERATLDVQPPTELVVPRDTEEPLSAACDEA